MIRLDPRPVARIWGGGRFGRLAEGPVGELWLADLKNLVAEGPYAGKTVEELLRDLGPELLGAAYSRLGPDLPLMAKLLDSGAWLSVQVHPPEALAPPGAHGKDEAWYILEAAPGAEIIYGLTSPLTPEALAETARSGELDAFLKRVPVRPGELWYLPAGLIHALGPGLLVYEVSQRSEITYRLYDYGRDRPLHLNEALQVAHRQPLPPAAQLEHLEVRLLEGPISLSVPQFGLLSQLSLEAPTYIVAAGEQLELPGGRWILAWSKA